ncbi:transcriptional repressor [bacterium]|nr:transcriptional repressor [bacterium]
MVSAEIKFREYLQANGLKYTGSRAMILNAVTALDGHFYVEDLYDNLRRKNAHISRATVYRIIPLLLESHIIQETLDCTGATRYEHAYGRKHHDHLVCIQCGKIIEFSEDRIEKLQDEICRKNMFTAVEHHLSIRGYCGECRKKD